MATAIRVGQCLGSRRPQNAKTAVRVSMVILGTYTLGPGQRGYTGYVHPGPGQHGYTGYIVYTCLETGHHGYTEYEH